MAEVAGTEAVATTSVAERRTGMALLLLYLVAYAYVIPRGPEHNPDSRLALTYSVVERGSLAIDDYAAVTADRAVHDGHYYTDKAPGVSFLLAPLYAALRLLPFGDVDTSGERFVTRYLLTFGGIAIPSAIFATWLFHWLRRFVTPVGPRAALVAAYALGSPAYAFSAHAFGHVPAGISLFVAAALSSGTRLRHGVAGGAMLGAAVAFEYPSALPALLVFAFAIAIAPPRERQSRAAAVAAGAALPLFALGAYHTLAFGAPWRTGYAFVDPTGAFAAAQATGLFGVGWPDPPIALELLGGLKRGLVLVAPWVVLALPGAALLWRGGDRGRRWWVVCAGITFVALLLVNSGYAVWDGGASWGPRHVVPALPFVALLAAPAFARWPRTAGALTLVSITLTVVAVATGTLPPPDAPSSIGDFLLPSLRDGHAGNMLGHALGLNGWAALAPLGVIGIGCLAWARGWRRSAGVALVGALTLWAATGLCARYVEYAEGYYLYLAARVAHGAALYRDVASTQAPLPALLGAVLWHIAPGPMLPRAAALGCYAATAILAGALAARLSDLPLAAPLGAAIAGLLPLGAAGSTSFDANALLAPLPPMVALLLTRRRGLDAAKGGGPSHYLIAAGVLAAIGLGIKLSFAPVALAPLVVLATQKRALLSYVGALGAAAAAIALSVAAWAGAPALDGLLGELESPLHLAGAALAVLQFGAADGAALALAATGFWLLRRDLRLAAAHAVGSACALLPLLAMHQGTFVSIARPAEPIIAAYAASGVLLLTQRLPWPAYAPAVLTGLVLLQPFVATLQGRTALHAAPAPRSHEWVIRHRGGEALVPPHLAAHAQLRMPFDYADWTVLGMRAASGTRREAAYAARLVRDLEEGALPLVIADFRLGYVPGALEALERGYELAASEGSGPLALTLWLPRRTKPGTT